MADHPDANLDAIRQRFDTLVRGEVPGQVGRVTAWVAAHLPEVAWSTVGDVAQAAQASPATVVRALQRAGYAGYSDLQDHVRSGLPPSELVWKLARGAAASGRSTLGSIVEQEKANLDQLEGAVGRELPALAGMLAEAPRVLVTASLTSVPLGQHLATHLALLLGTVDFAEAGTARAYAALGDLRPDDLVIGLSFPRYAQLTLAHLAIASRTSPTVILTDRRGPSLPQARLTLRLPAQSGVHFSSSVAVVAATMALARLLHEEVPGRIEDSLSRIDAMWGELGLLHRPPGGRGPRRRRGADSPSARPGRA